MTAGGGQAGGRVGGRAGERAGGGADIVTVALGSGGFGDEQLVDQLMTLLAAGHDTTASALTWALYQLLRFPDKQRRLRDEVRAGLPPPTPGGGAVSSADVDALPYLHAVCSEALRTHSPVPLTVREAARDTTVQGVAVPRGPRLAVAPWATNVDAALWGPDAAEFRPERWLGPGAGSGGGAVGAGAGVGVGGAASNYAFLTFLHGPRSCIGAGFARAELACVLAAWVGRFDFALADARLLDDAQMRFKTAVTARPAGGMHCARGWGRGGDGLRSRPRGLAGAVKGGGGRRRFRGGRGLGVDYAGLPPGVEEGGSRRS